MSSSDEKHCPDVMSGINTIGYFLEKCVHSHPQNKAIINFERQSDITYEQLYDISKKYAAALIGLGLKNGDHIALWANNINEWIYLQLGAGIIGVTIVTVNTGYRSYELEYLLKQSDSRALFTISGFNYDNEYISVLNDILPELKTKDADAELANSKVPLLKHIINIGADQKEGIIGLNDFLKYGNNISCEKICQESAKVNSGDSAMIQYTSGTTGVPKGVIITHKNIIDNAYIISENIKLDRNDRHFVTIPFFHYAGCISGTLIALSRGAAIVITEKFRPDAALEAILKHECTSIIGVPTILISLINQIEKEKTDTKALKLKKGIVAGAICPPETMKKMIYELGLTGLCNGYGQTETGYITIVRPDSDEISKTETIGPAIKGMELKIINPATNEILRYNESGEICCRTATLKGYYKMPEATEKLIDSEGWLHTGDIGTLDEKGNCRILGRLKEMIITGGENVYPREIEEFLMRNPKIANAQVVGVPSKVFGEKIVAFIQLNDNESCTETELKNYCRNKIAQFKIPVKFYFIKEYPKTASGKIQKFKLVEMAQENQQN